MPKRLFRIPVFHSAEEGIRRKAGAGVLLCSVPAQSLAGPPGVFQPTERC